VTHPGSTPRPSSSGRAATPRGMTTGGLPRHPRGAAQHVETPLPAVGHHVPQDPRHPRGKTSTAATTAPQARLLHGGITRRARGSAAQCTTGPPDAGVSAGATEPWRSEAGSRRGGKPAGVDPSDVHHQPRGTTTGATAAAPDVGLEPRGLPRHPQGASDRAGGPPEAGGLAGATGSSQVEPRSRRGASAGGGPSDVHHHPRDAGDPALAVHMVVRLVGGEAGRALAAAQGRALASLLASLGDVEVGQGEEVSPS
jgi:hypothetical protein